MQTMLEYRKLTDAELEESLRSLAEWRASDNILARSFKFDTYKEGLVFALAVGYEADKLNHHPDLHIGYGQVRVETTTHDSGGLTPYDVELAQRIDRLAE